MHDQRKPEPSRQSSRLLSLHAARLLEGRGSVVWRQESATTKTKNSFNSLEKRKTRAEMAAASNARRLCLLQQRARCKYTPWQPPPGLNVAHTARNAAPTQNTQFPILCCTASHRPSPSDLRSAGDATKDGSESSSHKKPPRPPAPFIVSGGALAVESNARWGNSGVGGA